MAVMSFLAGLPIKFDAARTQILSNPEIVSLHDTFTRVLRTERSLSTSNVTSALVSRIGAGRGNNGRNSGKNRTGGIAGHGQYNSNQRVCYHCKKSGHTIHTCWDLHSRPQQQPPFANFATQENNYVPSDKSILISADEFARFSEFQASQKSVNPSSITNPPFIDHSDHMTGNKGMLFSFNPNKDHPNVTLADGSCVLVVGSGIDLMTGKIISKGRESGSLYTLETPSSKVPKPVACSSTLTLLEIHCRLSHPSLPTLKKLCPNFQNLSHLNCVFSSFSTHRLTSPPPSLSIDPSSDPPLPESLDSSLDLLIALRKDSISLPQRLSEALEYPGWRAAMEEEMMTLDNNGTWDLVHLPTGKKPIGCKWVFAVKVNPDGSVSRLNARLVAKGYTQTYGVDYSDTFSPVAKLTSIRLFISLAATNNWPLYQLDVKNAFLHGDLQEEVYMEQPPGFVAQGESGKVCRLRKSLYDLKQSPRTWFGRFSEVVQEFGMKKCNFNHSVFYQQSEVGIILLVVYIDDIVITGSNNAVIEITRCKQGIFLCQRKYVLDLLKATRKLGAKPCSAPMIPNMQLTVDDGELFSDPEMYRRLVRKLNYFTELQDVVYYMVIMAILMLNASQMWIGQVLKLIENLQLDIVSSLEQNLISTSHVRTEEQLADIFTKSLNGPRIDYICGKMGMINNYALS
ncbi:uncharacterized protein [Coffea arabica]|uniref:Reverse transcriptase Ty1/copia-type domain-containing protein n=1 Tax=Coffea arabica TaxID=13443 RepID=A0ABM4U627_COFAR